MDETNQSADELTAGQVALPPNGSASAPSAPADEIKHAAAAPDPTHTDDPSAAPGRVETADTGNVGNALGDPAAVGAAEDDEPPAPRAPEKPYVEKGPLELIETQVGPTGARDWYILKVQSNREDSIRDALERKIAIAGLKDYFGDIIVPTEMVSEFKNGKKRVVKRKLYPGYIVVHMELNDDTWYLVRDTHGIGDFTGAGGKPSPMPSNEIAKILNKTEEKAEQVPEIRIKFDKGDRVKINEGTFENFEGDVDAIDRTNGRVTVMINIFGRSTPVELEYWQIESV